MGSGNNVGTFVVNTKVSQADLDTTNIQVQTNKTDILNKVDKLDGKDLSDENYTTEEKTKLANIVEIHHVQATGRFYAYTDNSWVMPSIGYGLAYYQWKYTLGTGNLPTVTTNLAGFFIKEGYRATKCTFVSVGGYSTVENAEFCLVEISRKDTDAYYGETLPDYNVVVPPTLTRRRTGDTNLGGIDFEIEFDLTNASPNASQIIPHWRPIGTITAETYQYATIVIEYTKV